MNFPCVFVAKTSAEKGNALPKTYRKDNSVSSRKEVAVRARWHAAHAAHSRRQPISVLSPTADRYQSSVLPKNGDSGLTRSQSENCRKHTSGGFGWYRRPPKNSVRVRFGGDKHEQCLKDYSVW